MPKVVEPDLPEAGLPGEPLEVPGRVLGMQLTAVQTGEDQAALDPSLPRFGSLAGLLLAVPSQRLHRQLVQVDAPVLAARGFRPADDRLVAKLHDLLPDGWSPWG